jgi:hypothetical protein
MLERIPRHGVKTQYHVIAPRPGLAQINMLVKGEELAVARPRSSGRETSSHNTSGNNSSLAPFRAAVTGKHGTAQSSSLEIAVYTRLDAFGEK